MDETDPLVTRQILDAIRAGDRSAFDALFSRVGGKVYVYIRGAMGERLRAVAEPEDVLQEVYTAGFLAFEAFVDRGSGSFAQWLVGVARNQIRRLYKHYFESAKRDPRRETPLERGGPAPEADSSASRSPAASDPTPSLVVARDEEVQRTARAVEALDPEDRKLILMHVYEGVALREIARAEDVPFSTLTYRFSRALRTLGADLR